MQAAISVSVILFAFSANPSFAFVDTMSANDVSTLTDPTEILTTTSETKFQILESKFQAGTVPNVQASLGGWTGRCFRESSQDVAEGRLLLIDELTVGGNNGPLFSAEKKWVMAFITYSYGSAPAEQFDVVGVAEKESIELLRKSAAFQALEVTTENGSLVSTSTPGNLKYSVRQYENYYIGRSSVVTDVTIGTKTYKAGDVFTMCYFFAKVL